MDPGKSSVMIIACLLAACVAKGPLTADTSQNAPARKNTVFKSFEDLSSPKFEALRTRYQLDTLFKGEVDEFRRQLLLRNWIRTIIQIRDFEESYPGEGVAEQILDLALKGQGYHCGHYMTVQNAVMNAYGYVTRCLGAGPGVRGGPDGHHGVNEIWSNKFRKWYLSDAKYNHHFERDGIPLSALEIREEYLKDRGLGLTLVKGPGRTPVSSDGVMNASGAVIEKTISDFAQTYTWISWESYNNRYTDWPESGSSISILNVYADDYFKKNVWIWDGKPHWAYTKSEHMIRVEDRNAIEWTPNTISARVSIHGDSAIVDLASETPNLKSYQMKAPGSGQWHNISPSVRLRVESPGLYLFRTVNRAGVAGPVYKVLFKRD